MAEHFGTDGIRGPVGQGLLTPEGAERMGRAVGMTFADRGDVVALGYDPRDSSPWLAEGVAKGLNAVGVDAEVVGVIPTPGLAYTVRNTNARAGVMLTASHNPPRDNGYKVVSAEGGKLSDGAEAGINAWLDTIVLNRGRRGVTFESPSHKAAYIDFLVGTVDTSFKGMRIGLDTANGAASEFAEEVFGRRLGAITVPMFNRPNGRNINEACGAMHPGALQQAVEDQGLDLGLAFDGDADRLILVADRVLNGDNTLHILALGRGEKRVIGTVMANMGLEVALAEQGIRLDRTKVGDRYVVERLIAENLRLGGEQSGHTAMMDILPTGDGMLTGIQVIQELRSSGESLAAWGNMWKPFQQELVNVPLNGAREMVMSHPDVLGAVAQVEAKYAGTGRVVLRPSGTEPLVRVMVEGAGATDVANYIAGIIRQVSR